MSAINYLTEKLKELHNTCPYIDIKYEYVDYINTHVIDVRPKESFEKDEGYVMAQLNLEEEFEKLFPAEEILFITENKLISIEQPILELESPNISDFSVDYVEPSLDEIFFNYIQGSQPTHIVCSPIDEFELFDIETECNEISIEIPPPKNWWSKLNKKSSKDKLEFFFV